MGWGFDHPGPWQFSPVESHFSFQSTIGYLGTIPIDAGTICQTTATSATCDYRAYDLPPGNVIVLLSNAGIPMNDPVAFYDHPAEGSRVSVAGMPATFELKATGQDRELVTWRIARPDAFGNWVQLDADIRGPEMTTLQGEVEALVASFRFEPPPVPMPSGDAAPNMIAAKAAAALMALDADAYACFPDRTGVTKQAEVRTLPGFGPFRKPLPVSCTITIVATDVGLWRMDLDATWTAAADRSAGATRMTQWLFPDGTLSASSGGGGEAPY